MRTIALSLACALGVGCATNPARHVAANGDPLIVDVRDELYTYTARETVGEVEHRDSSGALVGTSTMTQDVQRTGVARTVTLLQGSTALDEQDFYAIAGDEPSRKKIEDERAMGEWLQNGGLAAAGVGGGVLLLSFVPLYLAPQDGTGGSGFVGAGALSTVGLLTMSAGGLAYFYGNGMLAPGRFVFDEAHAQRAAEGYNARLAAARDVDGERAVEVAGQSGAR